MIRHIAAATVAVLFLATAAVAQQAPGVAKEMPTPPKPFVYTPKSSDIVIGKDSAPVTIVEYASLSCPHCAHFYTNTLPDITKKYIDTGKVKLVYRNFPLNGPAVSGAELLQCAPTDRRETFLKVLFTTQDKWAYDANYKESLAGIAALGGINRADFDACMANKQVSDEVGKVAKEAQDDYKVASTPTFYINGSQEMGDHSVESMSKSIDAALTAKK